MSNELKASLGENKPRTVVELGKGVTCGGKELLIVGGPCSVESKDQMEQVGKTLEGQGVGAIRGGVYKPRTSPYSYQGMGEEGLEILSDTSQKYGMPVITEVMSEKQADIAVETADVLQIGSRNMQNFELLKHVGTLNKPVILKRGLSATLEELVLAAEYIMAGGNHNVILCERGIRSYDNATRNVLDLGGVVALRQMTHLPIIVDPSHACGRRELVADLARAAVACGADGLMIECHPQPEKSISDARQAISLQDMIDIVRSIEPIAAAVGRTVHIRNREERPETTSQLAISAEPASRANATVQTSAPRSIEASAIPQSSAPRSNLDGGNAPRDDQNTRHRAAGYDSLIAELNSVRREIDKTDAQIARLLQERLAYALRVGDLKQELKAPARDVAREREVIERISSHCADPQIAARIRSIYDRIIEASRQLQVERALPSRVA